MKECRDLFKERINCRSNVDTRTEIKGNQTENCANASKKAALQFGFGINYWKLEITRKQRAQTHYLSGNAWYFRRNVRTASKMGRDTADDGKARIKVGPTPRKKKRMPSARCRFMIDIIDTSSLGVPGGKDCCMDFKTSSGCKKNQEEEPARPPQIIWMGSGIEAGVEPTAATLHVCGKGGNGSTGLGLESSSDDAVESLNTPFPEELAVSLGFLSTGLPDRQSPSIATAKVDTESEVGCLSES